MTLSFIDFTLVRFFQRLLCNTFSFQFHLGLRHRTHIDNSNVGIVEVFILYKYSFYYYYYYFSNDEFLVLCDFDLPSFIDALISFEITSNLMDLTVLVIMILMNICLRPLILLHSTRSFFLAIIPY